ncbi:hypothetical protein Ancab_007755, partial [Ancistrocladus abbreviatus]
MRRWSRVEVVKRGKGRDEIKEGYEGKTCMEISVKEEIYEWLKKYFVGVAELQCQSDMKGSNSCQ